MKNFTIFDDNEVLVTDDRTNEQFIYLKGSEVLQNHIDLMKLQKELCYDFNEILNNINKKKSQQIAQPEF